MGGQLEVTHFTPGNNMCLDMHLVGPLVQISTYITGTVFYTQKQKYLEISTASDKFIMFATNCHLFL